MRNLRRFVKYTLAHTLYYSGILYLLIRIRLRERAVVLTYHRVITDDMQYFSHSSPGIIVKKDVFEKHLEAINRFFRPLSIGQFQEYITSGKQLPDRSLLLTFDDGWLDNHETAFPLLKQHQVPATIFLPLNYISNSIMFWQEELMLRLSTLMSTGNKDDIEFVRNLATTAHAPGDTDLRACISELKVKDYQAINAVLELVRSRCNDKALPFHYDKYMSWEQVIEMQHNGISFGSHALSHRILTRISEEECGRELNNSRAQLEARLGVPVTTLAYPNGDHDEHVEHIAEQAGYILGFTTEKGYAGSDTKAYSIPRINIHNSSSCNKAMFLCTIMGIF